MEFYSIKYKNWLIIKSPKITNLEGLSSKLSKIEHLRITGRRLNSDVPVPMNFRSFKGLPNKLPMLEDIEIYDSIIQNLETLTAEIPRLKYFRFENCNIHNLKGIPKTLEGVSFMDCQIDSFEGLDVNNLNILDRSAPHIFLHKTSFSSLHGINRITLQSILIEYFSRFENLYALASLTTKGIELLNDCVNSEVNNANNPLEILRRELPHIYPSDFGGRGISFDPEIKHRGVDYFFNNELIDYPPTEHWNEDKAPEYYEKDNWIYALSLEDQLFNPEKIARLLDFYKKSPTELAMQYRSDPKSLPKNQIQRLIHESDNLILKILENYEFSSLQNNDPVIARISRKFTVRTKKGKILL